MSYCECPVSDMVGAILTSIDGMREGGTHVIFTASDGRTWNMYHQQDCCEYVDINDVCGDVEDLLNTPLVVAEELSSEPDPGPRSEYDVESYTWTFYRFRTIKGTVTLRWYGSSNGYYSESVTFERSAKESES